MKTLPRTMLIYVGWLAIAVLVYPIALAIPMGIHFITQNISASMDTIVPMTYLRAWDDRTFVYFMLYAGLLGVFQQVFLDRILSIRIRWWAVGTFFGGASVMCILRLLNIADAQTPFTYALTFAPFLFGISILQAVLLSRFTSWAWLWVVAHLSISTMFPITVGSSALELVIQWGIKAGIAGIVTMGILQLIVTRAEQDHKPKRKASA